MRTAIVQIDIKPEAVVERWHEDAALVRYHQELIDLSKKTFMHYAQITGSDYILHTTAVWPSLHPQVEIFRNLEKLNQYDYVACFDIDMVCNTEENIFDHCVLDKINHVPRSPREKAKGAWCFNSGTVVFGNKMPNIIPHIDLMRTDQQNGRDQMELQNIMDKLDCGHELPLQFNNYREYHSPDNVNIESIMHFKGGQKDSWYPKVREELLEKWN